MPATVAAHHTDWLSVVETSGPFLTLPVLKRALPQGLEPTPPDLAAALRSAYDEWQTDPGLHGAWIRWVLTELLGHSADVLRDGQVVPQALAHEVAEHGLRLRPDLAVIDPADGRGRLLIRVLPAGAPLGQSEAADRWAASPLDRMVELLRATGVRLGLVTNGDTWTLVDAPRGAPAAYATWEAGVWTEERVTLDAFRTLLSAPRFFAVAETDTLEALLAESADAEAEVTDQLGLQVREAVELLVDAFSDADRASGGALLVDVKPERLYAAAVTVMMRVVFLLSAEERGLFLLGDPRYDASYAISTLRGELQEQADRAGSEEPLERRSAAWHRVLATFRLVHGGVQHEDLRLPAYGGSLFDPDRYPFLEGRGEGESWTTVTAWPLPVDDRTVLHILDALQVLRFRHGRVTEARRLSFRALDVEQIGHVYEGLLDHAAVRAEQVALGLRGKREPELAAEEVVGYDAGNRGELVEWLRGRTGLTRRQTEKALAAEPSPVEHSRLLAACDNDADLAARIEPYWGLLRTDLRDLPKVFPEGSVYVTQGSERRSTGTYYTPRSLAEEMVLHALEPLVYAPGPAEGADRAEWRLKPAAELLGLKVCDMAMGSGAFLVASCRFLADRLVEAWQTAEQEAGGAVGLTGLPVRGPEDALPIDAGDRELLARRLVADRCLYGVDANPMAVEMAKLSLWLLTLAQERPFAFLDHALKVGDSLLGVTDLAQLEHLHIEPRRGRELHDGMLFDYQSTWAPIVKEAIEKRQRLESFPVVTVRDAEEKARLHREAERVLGTLRVVGDVVVGAAISTVNLSQDLHDGRLLDVAPDVAAALEPDAAPQDREVRLEDLRDRASFWLDTDRPATARERRAFHWLLEFPEVFLDRARPGFDAVVGNPPFLGGTKISGPMGPAYRQYLGQHVAGQRTDRADLVAFFFLRGSQIACEAARIGLLATNTIAQGDTREASLGLLIGSGWIINRATRSRPWPGTATLEVAQVWLHKGDWRSQAVLDDANVRGITTSLDVPSRVSGLAQPLAANADLSFQGSKLDGIGFTLPPDEAQRLIAKDARNAQVLMPYLIGQDVNSRPDQSPSRWVINFRDWPLERAEQYPHCMAIVRKEVKPARSKHGEARVRERWWQYQRQRPELYDAIGELERVLVITSVSKTVLPALVPNGWVYAHALFVFAYDDDAHFGLLTSTLHWWWAVTRASTLETRIRYTPSDVFETFPQPKLTDDVAKVGGALNEHRSALMLDRQEGLTATYNRVHDPDERASDIVELRRLHVALDHAVAGAYGWDDLDLDHDFHDTRQGERYTLGPAVRTELLDRLLELNHARHRDELARGLHDTKRSNRRSRRQTPGQASLDGIE